MSSDGNPETTLLLLFFLLLAPFPSHVARLKQEVKERGTRSFTRNGTNGYGSLLLFTFIPFSYATNHHPSLMLSLLSPIQLNDGDVFFPFYTQTHLHNTQFSSVSCVQHYLMVKVKCKEREDLH